MITKKHLEESWAHILEKANELLDEPENQELADMVSQMIANHRQKVTQHESQSNVKDTEGHTKTDSSSSYS